MMIPIELEDEELEAVSFLLLPPEAEPLDFRGSVACGSGPEAGPGETAIVRSGEAMP